MLAKPKARLCSTGNAFPREEFGRILDCWEAAARWNWDQWKEQGAATQEKQEWGWSEVG